MKKGWFEIPGVQEGERTLAEAVEGLELIGDHLKGKTVLDLGCAEGLIGLWCLERGAASVYGLDAIPEFIRTGRRLASELGEKRIESHFWNVDSEIDPPIPVKSYDIVLALSIIHKLTDPELFLRRIKKLAKRWIIVRAPGRDIKVRDIDTREWYRLDIKSRLAAGYTEEQFGLVEQTPRAKVPWAGTFKRLTPDKRARTE